MLAGVRRLECRGFGIAGIRSWFCVAWFTRFALLGVDTLACVCVYCLSAVADGSAL